MPVEVNAVEHYVRLVTVMARQLINHHTLTVHRKSSSTAIDLCINEHHPQYAQIQVFYFSVFLLIT